MSKKTVVLLHGIKRSNLDMIPLQKRLEKEGYTCINLKYPSTKYDLRALTDRIHKELEENDDYKNADRVDFVAHSMGGLLVRYLLTHHRPKNLGSVVMLGTPNKGSEVADFLSSRSCLKRLFNFFFGPAGAQLRTGITHFDHEVFDYPIGIIASDVSLNPIGKKLFGGANDTLVSIENTKIDDIEMTPDNHIVISAGDSLMSTHALMMFDPLVIDQVVLFLKNGKFDHAPTQQAAEIDITPADPEELRP